jgi:hypothetical protein
MVSSTRVVLRWSCATALIVSLGGADGLLAGGDAADEAMQTVRPEAIRAGMRFLSDDALEGRGTGSRGFEIAAKFVASQFESLGLQPAGDNGTYFQTVPLRSMKIDEANSNLTLTRGGNQEILAFRKDFITYGDPARTETSVEAPVVFVGGGVTAPEQGYDDYKGIDVRGKIVALIYGAPNFESSVKAHYSSFETKATNAVAHGAVGAIVLDDPILERLYPFSEQVRDLSFPQFRWLDKQQRPNNYFPELKGNAFLSLNAVKKFFAGSPHTAEEVFASMKAGKPLSFAMPLTAKIKNITRLQDVQSRNIIAKLEGSDPNLKREYLVYSSHLDHLGIGEAVKAIPSTMARWTTLRGPPS